MSLSAKLRKPIKAPNKTLTDKIALEYLKKAKGDAAKARQMAIADGYEIPEEKVKAEEPKPKPEPIKVLQAIPVTPKSDDIKTVCDAILKQGENIAKAVKKSEGKKWKFEFETEDGMIVGMTAKEIEA